MPLLFSKKFAIVIQCNFKKRNVVVIKFELADTFRAFAFEDEKKILFYIFKHNFINITISFYNSHNIPVYIFMYYSLK